MESQASPLNKKIILKLCLFSSHIISTTSIRPFLGLDFVLNFNFSVHIYILILELASSSYTIPACPHSCMQTQAPLTMIIAWQPFGRPIIEKLKLMLLLAYQQISPVPCMILENVRSPNTFLREDTNSYGTVAMVIMSILIPVCSEEEHKAIPH